MRFCRSVGGGLPWVLWLTGMACTTVPGEQGDGTAVGTMDSGSPSASGGGSPSSGGGGSSGSGSSGSDSGSSGGSSSGSSGGSGAGEAGPPATACSDTSTTAGTIAAQFAAAEIDVGASKTYFLQSNWWQTYASETEDYAGLSFTVHNPQGASVPASDGAPMGFPSIFIGQYAGHATVGSNLPRQVSALTSVPTTYQTNNSSIGTAGHNATYDVWFTQDGTPLSANQSSPGTGGAYLMVWMFKPTDRQPRGSDNARTGQTVSGVPGTWSVWYDPTDPPCVSYVSDRPIDGLEFDLDAFIKDAVAKRYGVTSSMYLSIVFGGFEVWGGADGLALTQFCATVN